MRLRLVCFFWTMALGNEIPGLGVDLDQRDLCNSELGNGLAAD
jgi:hypothetical protein